jgi:HSP20 family protein
MTPARIGGRFFRAADPAPALQGVLFSDCSKGGVPMSLMRWEPFRALRRPDDAFEEMFRDFFRRTPSEEATMMPAAEVAESEGEVTVKLEIPGVDKDHLELTVADDELTVRGETRKETEEKKKSYYRQEIRYGSFQRTVPLPVEVDGAKASAELKNGVLKVTLPKSKHPKAHSVKVAVA